MGSIFGKSEKVDGMEQLLIPALIVVLGFAALLAMDLAAQGVRSLTRRLAAWRDYPLQTVQPLIGRCQEDSAARLGS